jgi:putative heme-binding domain-containing protein
LLRGWKGYAPALRLSVVDALLQRPEGVKALLEALEKKRVSASEVDAARRQRLLEHRDQKVRQRAVKAFAGAVDPDRQKVIDAYRTALKLTGDVTKGRATFRKTCSTCHKLEGVGNEVGPDLAPLADRPGDYLLVAILDPNRAVEARYVNYVADLKDGRQLTGVLLAETGTSITLVGPDGKAHVLLRTNLASLESTGRSAMPEGLEKDLQPQDMADLLAYLRSPGARLKAKSFAGNKPELVRAEKDGSLSLLATNAEIHGPTLVYEAPYRNLGFWSKPADRAVWEIEVPKGGKYTVWMDWACPPASAGNTYRIEAGSATLRGKVASTGAWETYRQTKVGELTLEAGRQRVGMRADGPIRGGALLDLRGLRLVPVGGK